MKRWGNLLEQIASPDNIEEADHKAQLGKHNIGIELHRKNAEADNKKLIDELLNLTYQTSTYSTFLVYEPKERVIFRLPFYPDRIVHHAIMNVMEDKWVSTMIDGTYACIKERGIHKLASDLKRCLKTDRRGTTYCLKIDIKKFYPSINHEILKKVIRRKIKDKRLLVILDGIIESSDGVPIGNYLSQFFANLYLTYFDHWLKEVLKIKYYFRYCDDIAIFADNKEQLWDWFYKIKEYLEVNLKLDVKKNWQVFPVEKRGVDFVGYKFFHTHTLIRKSIKMRIHRLVNNYVAGKMTKDSFLHRMSSYYGWLKHCNSKNFLRKLEEKTGIHFSNFEGKESIISNFYGRTVFMVEMVTHNKYTSLHFISRGRPFEVRTQNKRLKKYINRQSLPKIIKLYRYEKSKKSSGRRSA